jgi:hypothetical protein
MKYQQVMVRVPPWNISPLLLDVTYCNVLRWVVLDILKAWSRSTVYCKDSNGYEQENHTNKLLHFASVMRYATTKVFSP